MSAKYVWVQWNHHKRVYDMVMGLAAVLFVVAFVAVGMLQHRSPEEISGPVLAIRALGVLAVVYLHLILSIGPLTRIDKRFTPLLYNRRHMGVLFFLISLLHFGLILGYYGGFGATNPFLAVLANGDPGGVGFEFFGFLALLIFFVMAATSHDFWLANLGAVFWKWLHMAVYAAYLFVVMHVVFGAMQSERSLMLPVLLGLGAIWLGILHILAGTRENRLDSVYLDSEEWIDVCGIDEIPDSRARVVRLGDSERIAIFKHDGGFSALTNVCAHQGGPLGEGQIIDGCVTCPWHGYQYEPSSGCSPPPYTERVHTYDVRVEGDRVFLHPSPILNERPRIIPEEVPDGS